MLPEPRLRRPRWPGPWARPASWASPGRRHRPCAAPCSLAAWAGLGVAALPPTARPRRSTPSSSCSAAGLGFLPTYAQSILGGWVFGVALGLPAALVGFTGEAWLGYEIARRVSKDRVEELIERNPKARVIRDALVGRGPWRTLLVVVAPPAAAELALRPHQPGDGRDRRAAARSSWRAPSSAWCRAPPSRSCSRRPRRPRVPRTSRPSCVTRARGSSSPASWPGWPCSVSSARSRTGRCGASRPEASAPLKRRTLPGDASPSGPSAPRESPMSARILTVLLLAAGGASLASGCGGGGPTASTPTPGTSSTPAAAAQPYGGESVPKAFVRRRGASLVAGQDDRPVRLQGVCFGNGVWGNPSSAPLGHHAEIDLDRVRDMNMTAIRFYLNDALLQSGAAWDWIDRNVAWAKARGVVPDPQHARPARGLPVARGRDGPVERPREPRPAARAVEAGRRALQGGAGDRRLRPRQRADRADLDRPVAGPGVLARARDPLRGREPPDRGRAPQRREGEVGDVRGPQLPLVPRHRDRAHLPLLLPDRVHPPAHVLDGSRRGRPLSRPERPASAVRHHLEDDHRLRPRPCRRATRAGPTTRA